MHKSHPEEMNWWWAQVNPVVECLRPQKTIGKKFSFLYSEGLILDCKSLSLHCNNKGRDQIWEADRNSISMRKVEGESLHKIFLYIIVPEI